jgi:hypothetical protein
LEDFDMMNCWSVQLLGMVICSRLRAISWMIVTVAHAHGG